MFIIHGVPKILRPPVNILFHTKHQITHINTVSRPQLPKQALQKISLKCQYINGQLKLE